MCLLYCMKCVDTEFFYVHFLDLEILTKSDTFMVTRFQFYVINFYKLFAKFRLKFFDRPNNF